MTWSRCHLFPKGYAGSQVARSPGHLVAAGPDHAGCWVHWLSSTLGALGRDCLRLAKQLTLSVGSMMQSVKNSSLEMSETVFLLLLYVDVSNKKGQWCQGKCQVVILNHKPISTSCIQFLLIQQQFSRLRFIVWVQNSCVSCVNWNEAPSTGSGQSVRHGRCVWMAD